jgi:hypothetical protein
MTGYSMNGAGSGLLFDFEGSDVTGIADFYKRFGPVAEPYPSSNSTNSQTFLNKLYYFQTHNPSHKQTYLPKYHLIHSAYTFHPTYPPPQTTNPHHQPSTHYTSPKIPHPFNYNFTSQTHSTHYCTTLKLPPSHTQFNPLSPPPYQNKHSKTQPSTLTQPINFTKTPFIFIQYQIYHT